MSTVYIHVGTPKTGTSAIQVFFTKNRKLLKEKGVCYPDLGFDFPGIKSNRNAHCLNAYIYDENHKRLRDREREDRKSTRLNSSHTAESRMPSSA